MRCASCNELKANLTHRESLAIKGVRYMTCDSCIEKNLEPRHILILAMKSGHGIDIAGKIIEERRYIGPELVASEVIKSDIKH